MKVFFTTNNIEGIIKAYAIKGYKMIMPTQIFQLSLKQDTRSTFIINFIV